MKEKFLSILLTLCMALSLLPATAWAEDADGGTSVEHTDHCVCGESHTGNSHDVSGKWTGVDSLDKITGSGKYYLTQPVTLSTDTWKPADGVVLCLNGYSITELSNNNVISMVDTSKVTFTLTDCNGSGAGNGKITHTENATGRGVYVGRSCTFNMYGGSITGNNADNNTGGGVYVYGEFNMYGGSITQNTTNYNGGGVYVYNEFNMYGGSITDNTATENGGGVNVDSMGTFTMKGGSITGNTATRGGGVYVLKSFNMTGGSISGNTADYGGGVHVSGTFNMSGGEITGNNVNNNTNYNGGGVHVLRSSSGMTVSGSAKIYGNTKNGTKGDDGKYTKGTNGADNNVYLPEGKTIAIGTSGLNGNASIGVTTGNTPPVAFAKGGSSHIVTDTDKKAFFPDVEGYTVTLESNVLKLTTGGTSGGEGTPSTDEHKHFLCGGDTCTKVGHTEETEKSPFDAWTDERAANQNGGVSTAANSLPKQAGYYYLTKNVELSDTWKPESGVYLCLNGYNIIGANDKDVITVDSNDFFRLTDCMGGKGNYGKITHKDNETGRGVLVNKGGTFKMYGGSITDNNAGNNKGGGVYVDSEGTFNMYGGSITNNNATNCGGGVYVDSGSTFTMNGGKITGNKVTAGNNLIDAHGGGVFVYGSYSGAKGTFNMNGGEISGNTAARTGGGVCALGKFAMTGGSIVNNTVSNTTNDGGGGVNAYGGMTVSGNVKITGNTMNGVTNNVALPNGGTPITISGALTGAEIGVTTGDTPDSRDVKIAKGATGADSYKVTDTDRQAFKSDSANPVYNVTYNKEDKAFYLTTKSSDAITKVPEHEHPICGATCTDGKHNGEEWTGVSTLTNNMAAGNYYLTNTVNLSSTWKPANGVVLCLNGHSITGKSGEAVISVGRNDNSVTFTLTDCVGSGEITHTNGLTGRGVYMSAGTFNMYGGSITGNNTTAYDGGGVYAAGTFNMYGGSITGNTAGKGGGVYVYSEFVMSGGSITNNSAKGKGGGVYVYGIMTVSGSAKITGNTTSNVYLNNGKTITIDTNGLDSSASIGVTTDDTPSSSNDVQITGSSNVDYANKFKSDAGYKVVYKNNALYLTQSSISDSGSSSGGSSGGGGGSSKYAVTVSSAENGKVTLDKTTASRGSTVTITPQANDGFALDKITVTDKNGSEIKLTDNGNGTFTFTMPASKVTINTTFKATEKTPETEPPKEEVKQTVVKMQINSKRLIVNDTAYEKDAAPVIRNDRTLVPIRFITESLGGKVTWNEKAKEVVLTIDGKEIKMTIGKTLEKYGVAPIIMNDRTFVPIRFVADELGATVAWDEPTKTVTVTKTVTK